MTKQISEIEALQSIDNMFTTLETDQIERILDWISSKYKIKLGIMDKSKNSPAVNGLIKTNDLKTDLSIKDFITAKKPENYYERVACIAFYLEKMNGLENFKTIDITKANQDARLNKLPNPALYVADASRGGYSYLISIGGGKKALSARGEAFVNALPDREKVKQVLEEFPIKKGGSKRTGRSKKNKN